MATNSETFKLTYFNMKGLAEPIRMVLAVAGVKYEDVRLKKEDWPLLKEKYEYGQLPVLEVGDKKLSQSNAIIRYLGKQFDLNGSNDWEAAKIDELADVLVDFRAEWRRYFMEKDPEAKEEIKKKMMGETIPKYLGKVNDIKKENGGKFLVGDKLTWVDIQYAHFLELFVETMSAEVAAPFTGLMELQKAVFEVPEIKNWIECRPKTEF